MFGKKKRLKKLIALRQQNRTQRLLRKRQQEALQKVQPTSQIYAPTNKLMRSYF